MLTNPTPPKSIEDYKDRAVRYVQRCTFETRRFDATREPETKLILDYMGAAEYEFGSVPESRERMRNSQKSRMTRVIEGKTFQILFAVPRQVTSDEDLQRYVDWLWQAIGTVIDGTARLKMGSRFQESLKGPYIQRLKKGCKKKMETVRNHSYFEAWWDIQNDWIMWFDHPVFNICVETLFQGPVKPGVVKRVTDSILSIIRKRG